MTNVIGYKFTNKDGTPVHGNSNIVYEVGKTIKIDGKLEMCVNGLHFSEKLGDAVQYVNGDRCFKVEAQGDVIRSNCGDKHCTNELYVIEELDIVSVL
jgi:hypothetical protein